MAAVLQFWIGRVENDAFSFLMEPSETVILAAVCGVSVMIGSVVVIEYSSFRFGRGCLVAIELVYSGGGDWECASETVRCGRSSWELGLHMDSLRR